MSIAMRKRRYILLGLRYGTLGDRADSLWHLRDYILIFLVIIYVIAGALLKVICN